MPDPAPLDLEPVVCDYCGSDVADVLLTGADRLCGLPGTFTVVRCRGCGLARTNPRPTPESLARVYPPGYDPHVAAARKPPKPPRGLLRWALTNRLGYPLDGRAPAPVRALLGVPARLALRSRRGMAYPPYAGQGRLLDFGCGAGAFVARMRVAGWDAEGMDLSPEAARVAREAGLTVHESTLPGADLSPASYDAVTLWHALEHVPSPLATLRAVRDLLRPGGWMLAGGPRIDALAARWFGSAWFGYDLPRHLTHFTTETLARHIEKAGLEVVHVRSRSRPGFLRHSFAQAADETGRGVHRWLARSRLVPGLLGWVELLARRTDEVLVLARRPAGD